MLRAGNAGGKGGKKMSISWKFYSYDYNTERNLELWVDGKKTTFSCDPFHNGIPVSIKAMNSRIKKAKKFLLSEYLKAVARKTPPCEEGRTV